MKDLDRNVNLSLFIKRYQVDHMKSVESAYCHILIGGFLTFWKQYEKEISEKGGTDLETLEDIQHAAP